ncbi:MAG: flavin monoamine oxidase family protein [Pseudobdellovibrionaceae bacterium]
MRVFCLNGFITFLLIITSSFLQAAPAAKELEPDVIIVGAGIAGLSTAYRLKKEGKSFLILEMSSHIGGRIRTASYTENVSAEVGLEEFWEGNPSLEIFNELKIPLEKSALSFSSFLSKGKLYAFGKSTNQEFLASIFKPQEIKEFENWDKKMAVLYHQLLANPKDKSVLSLKDISFAQWVRKTGKLSQKVQDFIRIESEPEYGTSWERISAMDGIAEWHLFSGDGTPSFHVVGGNHKAALAIADAIGKEHIILNRQVTNIKSSADGVELIATDSDFKQHAYRAKYVVTTAPLFRLNEIQFEPALSGERVQAIQTQGWGAYFTAHLVLDGKASHYWTQNGESILPIISDSSIGVIYEGKSEDDKKNAMLNLLITGDAAEGFNARVGTLDDVRATLLKEFEKLWPGIGKHIKKIVFYRYHPRAIASWPVGRSRFDDISDAMRKPQGRVYFGGDFTEGTHSDGAAVSAIRIVKDILLREKGLQK